jgi:hypothetical protein
LLIVADPAGMGDDATAIAWRKTRHHENREAPSPAAAKGSCEMKSVKISFVHWIGMIEHRSSTITSILDRGCGFGRIYYRYVIPEP